MRLTYRSISLLFKDSFEVFQALYSSLSDWILEKVWNTSFWIHVCKICDLSWVVIHFLENPSAYVHLGSNTFRMRFDWVVAWFWSNVEFVTLINPGGQSDSLSVVHRERCFHLNVEDFVFTILFMEKFVWKDHFTEFLEWVVFHEEINDLLLWVVDNCLGFSDKGICGGLFLVPFNFSICNLFPSSWSLELLNFFLNDRDELIQLFIVDWSHRFERVLY